MRRGRKRKKEEEIKRGAEARFLSYAFFKKNRYQKGREDTE